MVEQETPPARAPATLPDRRLTVTLTQQSRPACGYTISPNSYGVSSEGGSVDVTVSTTSGCEWTVTGSPAWVSANPNKLTGAGTTTITVQTNIGAARSTTVRIAGTRLCRAASKRALHVSGRTAHERRSLHTINPGDWRHHTITLPGIGERERVLDTDRFGRRTMGSGEIVIRVDENTSRDARSAPITITGDNFVYAVTVIQAGKINRGAFRESRIDRELITVSQVTTPSRKQMRVRIVRGDRATKAETIRRRHVRWAAGDRRQDRPRRQHSCVADAQREMKHCAHS